MTKELKDFIDLLRKGEKFFFSLPTFHRGKAPDPYALCKANELLTMAGLLERQESDITKAQIDYIKHSFYGGMGSFFDYRIDESVGLKGNEIKEMNEQLEQLSDALFEALEKLKKSIGCE
jgi:hypothetical protein